jgi:hypothetical protein
MNLKSGDAIAYRNNKGQIIKTKIFNLVGKHWVIPVMLPGDLLEKFFHVDDLIAPY